MRGPGTSKFSFGPFVLDPAEHRLEREGAPVPLTPRVFALLLVLVERAGHLVTKETLLQRVWPGAVVEEANLSVQMSRLRRLLAIGPDSPPLIETVPKVGYRFVAPVQVSSALESGFDQAGPQEARGRPADRRGSAAGPSEQLRLTIQLISVRDGQTLWTEAVEGVFQAPLGVQDRISEEIAGILARLKEPRRRGPRSPVGRRNSSSVRDLARSPPRPAP